MLLQILPYLPQRKTVLFKSLLILTPQSNRDPNDFCIFDKDGEKKFPSVSIYKPTQVHV